jgi:PEP-CTERM motif
MLYREVPKLDRSSLTRPLLAAVLLLALMIASVASAHAQQVFGAPGEPGADCFTDGCFAGSGTDGESVTGVDAVGGAGGAGGNAEGNFVFGGNGGSGGAATGVNAFGGPGGAGGTAQGNFGFGGSGGSGGAATGVNAFGGPGGAAGNFPLAGGGANSGGNGGDAFASDTETSNGSHDVTASATAVGGAGGIPIEGQGGGGAGGNATATSSASANGTGDATASATATGGAGGGGAFDGGLNGNATATSSAFANGTGDATASATATNGDFGFLPFSSVSATAYAETANGGLAQAQVSTDVGSSTSIAKTSFGGVSVQSTVPGPSGETATAIAQGGTGQPLDIPLGFFGFSIALPDNADASTLIGGASNVADALLGPDDKIFAAAILNGSSTFNFSFQGDLILGVITGGFVDILANGNDILSENIGDDSVINLGSFGPNIDLTIEGFGSSFALGGAVPEPSTWAMMLLGFAGLGFVGYRQTRAGR